MNTIQFLGERSNAINRNKVTQIMDFLFEKIILQLFEFESCLLHFFDDDLNVFEMLLLASAENNDVVKIHHYKLTTVLQNN